MALWSYAHNVFFYVVHAHVTLAKNVSEAVNITLHEKCEHELVKAFDLNASQKAFLVGNGLHKVRPLVVKPLNHGVSERLPSNVGAFSPCHLLSISFIG